MNYTISDYDSPMTAYETKGELMAVLRRSILFKISESREVYDYKGSYVLRHGEISAPYFVIRKYKDGWALKIITHYIDGTLHAIPSDRLTVAQFSDLFRD
jgi:DNA helicase TIP49 (TBP-interacting protein)